MVVRILYILVVLALLGGTANSFSLQPHRSHHGWSSASVVIRRAKPRRADTGAVDTSVDDDDDEGEGCRVLLLDHLNINHERGRHDALKAFYFDFLGCGVDPRKYDNYLEGRKTVWANAGMHQFHLPEGDPDAQVFNGMITLIHDDLDLLMERYNEYLDGDARFAPLRDTEFLVGVVGNDDDENDDERMILVTDPWGTEFCILPSDDPAEDRAAHVGMQPVVDGHEPSHVLAVEDLTLYVNHDANLDGIGRFYELVLGARTIDELSSDASICIAMGERQTLTFARHPDGPSADIVHHDFGDDRIMDEIDAGSADDDGDGDASSPLARYPSNHGPHVSVYVTNLSRAYARAEELGVLYVNPRFKRRAHTLDEAIDQCMFRLIDVIDPWDEEGRVILRLEHEVRSATTRDGKRYKSCPLFADVTV